MGLDSGDTEAGMAWNVPTRSTGSSGRKESRHSQFPIRGPMTEESPEERKKQFQKRASTEEMTLELGLRMRFPREKRRRTF